MFVVLLTVTRRFNLPIEKYTDGIFDTYEEALERAKNIIEDTDSIGWVNLCKTLNWKITIEVIEIDFKYKEEVFALN